MIRLVPNTGIQYADLPEIPREKLVRHDFQMRVGERFSQVMPAASAGYRGDDDGDDYAIRSAGLRSRSGDLRVIDRLLSSNPRGIWIPLPFEGGALWVAVRMRKENLATGSSVIRAPLAIDTTLDSDGNLEGLSVDELGERAPSPTSRRFWRSRAVESWLRLLAVKAAEDSRNAADVARTVQELQVAVAGLADFLAKDPKRPASLGALNGRACVQTGDVVSSLHQSQCQLIVASPGAASADDLRALVQELDLQGQPVTGLIVLHRRRSPGWLAAGHQGIDSSYGSNLMQS